MQQNAAYRDAVLAELSELDDNPLQLLIAEIKQVMLQPQAEPAAALVVPAKLAQTVAQTAVPATAEPRGKKITRRFGRRQRNISTLPRRGRLVCDKWQPSIHLYSESANKHDSATSGRCAHSLTRFKYGWREIGPSIT
ncbi:MAG: hypothetical protein U5L01_03960 [Rheinheimera sp.]|nr:hypothetical protein [Rheinheimera sp.]